MTIFGSIYVKMNHSCWSESTGARLHVICPHFAPYIFPWFIIFGSDKTELARGCSCYGEKSYGRSYESARHQSVDHSAVNDDAWLDHDRLLTDRSSCSRTVYRPYIGHARDTWFWPASCKVNKQQRVIDRMVDRLCSSRNSADKSLYLSASKNKCGIFAPVF